MSKDPAVLFYTSDFLTGTSFFTYEQKGQYITLLCQQHQLGYIPEAHMTAICGSLDSPVIQKFTRDKNGFYYNERMREEAEKRANYCKSRANNKEGHNQYTQNKVKNNGHMTTHMTLHMENENENENINVNKDKKEPKKIYGEHRNVRLAETELQKLKDKFGDNKTELLITMLDEGIELKGYKYKSHYLAILKWAEKEVEKPINPNDWWKKL
jgi:uncharacterized protein YdaU (DUF1376 family)